MIQGAYLNEGLLWKIWVGAPHAECHAFEVCDFNCMQEACFVEGELLVFNTLRTK